MQETVWKIWKVIIKFFVIWIFYDETFLKLWRIFNIIYKFIMKSFLKNNFVLILIIWQMWLLISWLSISWLIICNIHLIVWNELTDSFWCIDCILMHYIIILILKAVWRSRQILLNQKQIKILSKYERWELNLLSCKITLLKLIL